MPGQQDLRCPGEGVTFDLGTAVIFDRISVFLKSALLSPHSFVFLWEMVFASGTSEVVQCFPVLAVVSSFVGPFFPFIIITESFQIASVSFGFVCLCLKHI